MKARKRKKASGIRIYIDQLEAVALFAAEIHCVVKSSNFRLVRQTIAQAKVPPAEASFAIFEANVESLGGR